jgi:hypothetical protein
MGSLVRRALGILPLVTTVVVAGAVFAPAEVRGECGDYIVYTKPAPGQRSDHTPAPGKCQGPNCSQAPVPAPMPQAPPSLRILPDQTLPVTDGQSAAPPARISSAMDAGDGSPVRRPQDVFHPPR